MKTKLLLMIVFTTFYFSSFAQGGTTGCWRVISAGQNFSMAIKSDGTMWGWGINSNRLGLGLGNLANQNLPVQIGTDTDWLSVSAGETHTLAVKLNGTLWSWGNGAFGQLGNGVFSSATPNVTQIGTATDWSSVSAGYGFSLAIKTNGTLWSWGLNNTGQLGDNTLVDKNLPIQVGVATDWLRVDAGGQHSLGVKTTGTLWAWGNNTFGQLGNGNNTTSQIPIQIGTLTNWSLVSAGFDHSLAIDNTNALFSWGNNVNGQLGSGTNTASNSPTQVLFTSDGTVSLAIAISAGNTHSLILRNDSSLWSCGFNTSGQLGQGTNVNTNAFSQVGTLTNWLILSAGDPHSLVLQNNFDLWSTGRNVEGQLGIGNNTSTNTLQPIACPVSLSVHDQGMNSNFKVYPNPTSHSITIDASANISDRNTITITNTQGQLIKRVTFQTTNGQLLQTIDLTNQSNGIYILTVTSDEHTYQTKIIKY